MSFDRELLWASRSELVDSVESQVNLKNEKKKEDKNSSDVWNVFVAKLNE